MSRRRAAMLAFPIAVLACACGEWVRYDEGQTPGGSTVDRGSLDEETRMRLATADHLDHFILDGLLAELVVPSADGAYVYFDYRRLDASDEGELALDRYLATLDVVSPDQLKDGHERLAYWINGYNAAVIRGVISAYGQDAAYSVSNGGFVFFDLPSYSFGGTALSLNQIEHAIVRGDETHDAFQRATSEQQARFRELHASLWQGSPVDARIHMALNCGSLSCPNLPASAPFAYRADAIDQDLDRAARAFAENTIKGAGPEGISQIFMWYAKDFEPVYGNAAGFIRMNRAAGLTGVNLDRFIPYDWSLNISPAP